MSHQMVGLGVASRMVRAVLIRDGAVVWRAWRAWGVDVALHVAVREALGECGARRWPRPAVVAAIGPAFAQFRPLHGLPSNTSAALATRAVRANVERFFVGVPTRLQVTAVSDVGDRLWAGTLDASIVDEVVRGCGEARHRVLGCAPTLALLGACAPNGVVDWTDGAHTVTAAYSAGDAVRIRQNRSADADLPSRDDEIDYADAVAAALSGSSSAFLFDSLAELRTRRARTAVRAILAASFTVALLGVAVGPGVRAAQRAAAANAEYALIAGQVVTAASQLRRRVEQEEARTVVRSFRAEAPALVPILADLSRAMPESTAIISFRLHGRGIAIVALSSAGAEVVEGLAGIKSIERPQVVGAITRETMAHRDLQRVAVAARWAPVGRRGPDGNAP